MYGKSKIVMDRQSKIEMHVLNTAAWVMVVTTLPVGLILVAPSWTATMPAWWGWLLDIFILLEWVASTAMIIMGIILSAKNRPPIIILLPWALVGIEILVLLVIAFTQIIMPLQAVH